MLGVHQSDSRLNVQGKKFGRVFEDSRILPYRPFLIKSTQKISTDEFSGGVATTHTDADHAFIDLSVSSNHFGEP